MVGNYSKTYDFRKKTFGTIIFKTSKYIGFQKKLLKFRGGTKLDLFCLNTDFNKKNIVLSNKYN